jgi:hypothetical protein
MHRTVWFLTLALASFAACSDSSLPTQPTPGPGRTPGPETSPLITFSGVVAQSETNAPIAGVTVCYGFSPPTCAFTGADGSYHFTIDAAHPTLRNFPRPIGSPGTWTNLCPYAFLDGYEQRGACVPLINNRISWSATLQRTITLDAGHSVRSTVFKGEGNGVVDWGLCEPCKSFNVVVPGSGTLFLNVVPDAPSSKLRIQVFYKEFENGALRITSQRSIQVVVHTDVAPAAFELVTSFSPGS